MLGRIGADIGRSTRWTVLQNLKLAGVTTVTKAAAERIIAEGVVYRRDGEERLLPADTVVIACGAVAETAVVERLKDVAAEYYAVGDCVKPRKALDAIHEAEAVARQI
jgi:2,4-dienoyl-CoA reductase (NADPH2)